MRADRSGFTLIELMVVIGLMGLITAFALPAFLDANRSGALRSATFQLNSTLSLARQTAITTRQNVHILFPDSALSLTDETRPLAYTAYAVFGDNDGYMSDWTRLPNNVVFHADWSFPGESGPGIRNIFLQDTPSFEVSVPFPRADSGNQDVLAFTFRPDGALDVAGFNRKGIYLTEGWVDQGTMSIVFLPNTPVFGLEIRPESGQARFREYNP